LALLLGTEGNYSHHIQRRNEMVGMDLWCHIQYGDHLTEEEVPIHHRLQTVKMQISILEP
jgi:hypothetical protein